MAENDRWVDLGFAEECDPEDVTNRYFPSKIGGKPAWLELQNLPSAEEIKCLKCGEPRVFLCQIYAPIESKDDCFHRTIFVFICKTEQCQDTNSASNLIVFRSQLPRENIYYSAEPPAEDEKLPAVPPLVKVCSVCGCYASKVCSQCKRASYCSQSHQKIDWNHHKKTCQSDQPNQESHSNGILFLEFEVVMEQEPSSDYSSNQKEDDKEAETRRLKEYDELEKSGRVGDLKDVPESELAQYVSATDDDKLFRKFKKRIAASPDQVLRYERGGKPLLITDKNAQDESDIPKCEHCGANRIFEFQIMPQLLNVLKDDKLDWGILAVYTCLDSCNPKSGYLREFVLKQDCVQ